MRVYQRATTQGAHSCTPGAHLYSWMERGTIFVSTLPEGANLCNAWPRPHDHQIISCAPTPLRYRGHIKLSTLSLIPFFKILFLSFYIFCYTFFFIRKTLFFLSLNFLNFFRNWGWDFLNFSWNKLAETGYPVFIGPPFTRHQWCGPNAISFGFHIPHHHISKKSLDLCTRACKNELISISGT